MSRVAVVTGAARGIGRGIALVLAEAGAKVYVTDRESRTRRLSDLPGTVEDTAEEVTRRGGTGIAVPVDHADDAQVAELFTRVRREQAGLDLLVANAFDGNALPFAGGAFWTLPLAHWRNMMHVGVRSHLVSAWHAAPLLIERSGLLVLTGYADDDAPVIANHVFYDLAMTAISRLARTLDHDLAAHGATAIGLSPGFTRTEAIVAALGDAMPPGVDPVDRPGRAVRTLLEDPERRRYAGRTVTVAELTPEADDGATEGDTGAGGRVPSGPGR